MKGGDEDHDVIEATAALKGMLGIGGTTTAASADDQPPQGDGAQNAKAKSKKPKKKKNKAKGNDAQGQKPSEPLPAEESPTAPATTDQSKQNRPNSQKKKNQPKKKKESGNYAWSAFQSSPDPSKLPIPEFATPVADEKDQVSAHLVTSADPVQLHHSNSEKPSEASPASASEDQHAAIDTRSNSDAKFESNVEEPLRQEASAETAGNDTADDNPSPEPPVSETGVNLAAALVSSPPQEDTMHSNPPVHPVHPLSVHHVPPAYGAGPGMSPPMYPYHQPPRYPMSAAGSPTYPLHTMQMPPPPPPGYMTIQVQVPPVLMPGRQMIVTSPAGYPVQVVVPDGIPPGMIIPVHVPAGPPMHMIPPTHPSSYGRYYNPSTPPH
jgi:hypothetical protein